MSLSRLNCGIRRDLVTIAFEEWFGIAYSLADLLAVLFEAHGDPRAWRDLAKTVNAKQVMTRNAFEVRICELRKAMICEAIDTEPGGLYLLTEVGIRECEQGLARMGDVLRTVGGSDLQRSRALRPVPVVAICDGETPS